MKTLQQPSYKCISDLEALDEYNSKEINNLVRIIGNIRDIFPIPNDGYLHGYWLSAMSSPKDVVEYVRQCVKANN